MKHDTLEIKFQNFDDFSQAVKGALTKKKKLVQRKNQIFFDSIESYRKFMTIQKIEILTAIAQQRPSSIYELAKLLDRNFAAVFRDCINLKSVGFIKLTDNDDAKNSKTPLLKFDYDRIRVDIPNRAFNIEISEAA